MKRIRITLPNYFYDSLEKQLTGNITNYEKIEEDGVIVKKKTGIAFFNARIVPCTNCINNNLAEIVVRIADDVPYKETYFELDSELNIIGKLNLSSEKVSLILNLSKFINIYLKNSFTTEDSYTTEVFEKIFNRFLELKCEQIKSDYKTPEYLISDKPSFVYGIKESRNSGSLLRNSCMRPLASHKVKNYAGAYDGLCKIIYGLDENEELLFRALFWDVITEAGEQIKFLDRVYGSDEINYLLHREAIKNGWAFRNNGTHDKNIRIYKHGKEETINVTKIVPIDCINFMKKYGNPYFDTIKYLDLRNSTLYNYQAIGVKYSLADTSADSIKGVYSYKCKHCTKGSDEESEFIETIDGYVCKDCFETYGYTKCKHCGLYHNKETLHGYCTLDCLTQAGFKLCPDCGKLFSGTESYCEECIGEYVICTSCSRVELKSNSMEIETLNGSLHLCYGCARDLDFCSDCASPILRNDFMQIGGKKYCKQQGMQRLKEFDNY